MTTAIAILMKDPSRSKTRLAAALDCDARERLSLLLFDNTLAFFTRGSVDRIVGVVTASERIARLAHSHGAEVIDEGEEKGIDVAAGLAARWASLRGCGSLLVVHADIPALAHDEVNAMLEAGRRFSVVVAESIDGGTNALLVSPPDAIEFHFGRRSAQAHRAAARSVGLEATSLILPCLSRDLDTPADLRIGLSPPGVGQLQAFAVEGIPEVGAGDDIASLVVDAVSRAGSRLEPGDIVVIAQKIVSKSEGRLKSLDDFPPTRQALEVASAIGKDPRKVQAILSESTDIVRAERRGSNGLLITRHRNGWICANAGIDESNLGNGREGMLLLLPQDADRSARAIRDGIEARSDGPIGVIVSDTFGRPWRNGLVNVAIGVAGIPAIVDWAGRSDAYGRVLRATLPAFADEVAAAAGLLMQKDAGIPIAVVRGLSWTDRPEASARDLLRPFSQELFI